MQGSPPPRNNIEQIKARSGALRPVFFSLARLATNFPLVDTFEWAGLHVDGHKSFIDASRRGAGLERVCLHPERPISRAIYRVATLASATPFHLFKLPSVIAQPNSNELCVGRTATLDDNFRKNRNPGLNILSFLSESSPRLIEVLRYLDFLCLQIWQPLDTLRKLPKTAVDCNA